MKSESIYTYRATNLQTLMTLKTRVSTAKKGTRSLKTTIPEGIVDFLQLKDKDDLDWDMVVERNAKRTVVVRKSEKEREKE